MRNVLSVTTAMLVAVLPSACASNTAPDGVTVPPPPPRPATTTISVFQQGRHEGELVVPTCGAKRRGFVAPVRRVRVRGRFPTDRDIDVPPNLFHHYQALGEDTVSVMVRVAGHQPNRVKDTVSRPIMSRGVPPCEALRFSCQFKDARW